jgi:hypothetical protein
MVRLVRLKMVEIAFAQAQPRGQVIAPEVTELKSGYLLKSRMIRIHQITYQEKNGDASERLARNNELWSLQDYLLCKWSLLLWQQRELAISLQESH